MKYADYLTILDKHIASHPLKLGDGESVLTLLSESYEDLQGCSSGQIKEDFHELYRLLNGMPLTELDKIINPVCTLCRDHEQSGFIHGVQIGIRLAQEIWDKQMDRLQMGTVFCCHSYPSQESLGQMGWIS